MVSAVRGRAGGRGDRVAAPRRSHVGVDGFEKEKDGSPDLRIDAEGGRGPLILRNIPHIFSRYE